MTRFAAVAMGAGGRPAPFEDTMVEKVTGLQRLFNLLELIFAEPECGRSYETIDLRRPTLA